MNNNIKIARISNDVKMPSKRMEDGCYDIYAYFKEDFMDIMPHEVKLIPTGIKTNFSSEYRISIRERGSNTKSNMIVMAGQIDSNYLGEYFVAIYNGNDVPIMITKLENSVRKTDRCIYVPYDKAIAQFAIEYVPTVNLIEVSEEYINNLTTNRGTGCLGSSNK